MIIVFALCEEDELCVCDVANIIEDEHVRQFIQLASTHTKELTEHATT